MPDQSSSGDRCLVLAFPDGALLAVIDGLGHGGEAAHAAECALEVLNAHPRDSVLSLMRRCHEALRPTRGAVLSLAQLHYADHAMTWIGVGDVEAVLARATPDHAAAEKEFLLLRGGVVGSQLPPLYAGVVPMIPGDMLIFYTDGMQSLFCESLDHLSQQSPQALADDLLRRYGKTSDDALVLVARYRGEGEP